jgi:hypothetical protein
MGPRADPRGTGGAAHAAPAASRVGRRATGQIGYRHVRYDELVTFDFLLPLAHEGRLRRALDDLFHADAIARRLERIGLVVAADLSRAWQVCELPSVEAVERVRATFPLHPHLDQAITPLG